MFSALRLIISENIRWRRQIIGLALFELRKTIRGTVLGWFWLFVKPIIYIAVFWFALEIGLRASRVVGDYPFLLWLSVGFIPWFFMTDIIRVGSNVYRKFSYLINRVSFPTSVVPTLYCLSRFIIFCISMTILVLLTPLGLPLTIYAIQIPFLAIIMFLFFLFFSFMLSPISAVSKDFANLIRTLNRPIFWLSGILFDTSSIEIPWLQWFFDFNPVTFFAVSYRAALCDHYWIWENPKSLICFGIVFLATFISALIFQHRLAKEIPDVL